MKKVPMSDRISPLAHLTALAILLPTLGVNGAAATSPIPLHLGSHEPIATAHLPSDYLPVPLVPQATSYSCGAASLMAVLEYWNVSDAPETSLFRALHTTKKDGTEEASIAQVAREKFGLRSEVRTGLNLEDLRSALKDGTTVILDIQAWSDDPSPVWKNEWDDGHYVVLVAMDTDYAYAMDPSAHGAYAYLPLIELLDRWHDADDRGGNLRRFENVGIFVHGTQAKTRYPGDLIRML